jgi:hypothetical protein
MMFVRQATTCPAQLHSSLVADAASVLQPQNGSLKTAMMFCSPTIPRPSLLKWLLQKFVQQGTMLWQ